MADCTTTSFVNISNMNSPLEQVRLTERGSPGLYMVMFSKPPWSGVQLMSSVKENGFTWYGFVYITTKNTYVYSAWADSSKPFLTNKKKLKYDHKAYFSASEIKTGSTSPILAHAKRVQISTSKLKKFI